jgi:hypothetical protein
LSWLETKPPSESQESSRVIFKSQWHKNSKKFLTTATRNQKDLNKVNPKVSSTPKITRQQFFMLQFRFWKPQQSSAEPLSFVSHSIFNFFRVFTFLFLFRHFQQIWKKPEWKMSWRNGRRGDWEWREQKHTESIWSIITHYAFEWFCVLRANKWI